MNDVEKTEETNQDLHTDDQAAARRAPERSPEAEDPRSTEEVAPQERVDSRALWRGELVQEALANRPELRKLAKKQSFGASRRIGFDLGFEDGARKLTLPQLQAFGELLQRRLATYSPHEMPPDLRGYLDERGAGLDERGFLAGYVDGVGEFLRAFKEQLGRQG